MNIELTREQLLATPVRITDPETQREYVVVAAETFERLQALAASELDVRDTYPALDRTFAEGWSDPKMDDYDRYEDFKP